MLIWNVEIVTILMTYLRIQHDMLPWIGGHWVAALKSSTAGGIKGDSRHHGSYPPMLRKDGWNSFFPATFEVFGWLATEHLSNQSKHDSWHFGKHMFADGFLQDIWTDFFLMCLKSWKMTITKWFILWEAGMCFWLQSCFWVRTDDRKGLEKYHASLKAPCFMHIMRISVLLKGRSPARFSRQRWKLCDGSSLKHHKKCHPWNLDVVFCQMSYSSRIPGMFCHRFGSGIPSLIPEDCCMPTTTGMDPVRSIDNFPIKMVKPANGQRTISWIGENAHWVTCEDTLSPGISLSEGWACLFEIPRMYDSMTKAIWLWLVFLPADSCELFFPFQTTNEAPTQKSQLFEFRAFQAQQCLQLSTSFINFLFIAGCWRCP